MSHITPLDQEINAWYESQSEETLRDLQDRFDAQTPRQAWKAFFNDCAFPAQQSSGDSLAAPAEAGQGVCTALLDICPPLMLLPRERQCIYNRWKTVCDRARSHTFGLLAIQFRSLVSPGYLA